MTVSIGVAATAPPAQACAMGNVGQKSVVKYQADYIFWRAV